MVLSQALFTYTASSTATFSLAATLFSTVAASTTSVILLVQVPYVVLTIVLVVVLRAVVVTVPAAGDALYPIGVIFRMHGNPPPTTDFPRNDMRDKLSA